MSFSLPGRMAYLLVPHFAAAIERRERSGLAGRPVVVAHARRAAGQSSAVLDCSPEAVGAGVRPGMPLAQAERLCPEAAFLPPRLELYRAAAAQLVELLTSQMPLVEQTQPGGLFVGLAGLERRDDEALALCRQQNERIHRELGLATTAGVATNKFTAEAASLSIGADRVLVLSAGTEGAFLHDFPVAILPVDDETRRRLYLFGLRKLGQFARLPPAAVLAQFGWEGQRAHRLARGQDDRPLVAQHGERSEAIHREFEPPLDNLETLAAAAGKLVDALSQRLAPLLLRAGQIAVHVDGVDGARLTARRTLAEPTADAGYLARLAERLLRQLRYSAPVSDLALTLSDLTPVSLHQLSLWESPQAVEADAHLARLAARYGPSCFRHSALSDPEHRLASRRFVMTPWSEPS